MSDNDLIRRGDALAAVQAAYDDSGFEPDLADAAARIAALPARGVGLQDARDALEELANMPLGIPLEDWARLSARILAALEAATQADPDAHRRR